MKKMIVISVALFLILGFSVSTMAGPCMKPMKPILPIKPIWCSGQWVQILQCDAYCNCTWVPTCIQ